MIDVFRVRITKEQLSILTPDKRALLLLSGHSLNVFGTWLKLLTISSNNDAESETERAIISTQSHIILRSLYGSLAEGYEWLRLPVNQKLISQTYTHVMSEKSTESYAALRKHFGASSLLHRLRNQFSYHYPTIEHMDKAFRIIPDSDDWSWYLANEISNSTWLSSELTVGFGSIMESGLPDTSQGFRFIMDETMKVSNLFMDTLMGLIAAIVETDMHGEFVPEHTLRVEGAPNLHEFKLPFYFEGRQNQDTEG